MTEKNGPHMTVTPIPRSSSGGSISAISTSSCFSGTPREPERLSSVFVAE